MAIELIEGASISRNVMRLYVVTSEDAVTAFGTRFMHYYFIYLYKKKKKV